MKINIMGLGWFGGPLAEKLNERGCEVLGTTRSLEKQQNFQRKNIMASILAYPDVPGEIEGNVVVLNIPPFEDELDWFKKLPFKKDQWMIFISSISGSEQILRQEEWVKNSFHQWTILRFGGLFGQERHPGKHLSGKKNLQGRLHPVNLIHLDDTVDATIAVIEHKISGKMIHVVSDEHPSKENYYTEYCRTHQLPLPEFDQTDSSQGRIVSNDELKTFYRPRQSLTL